MLESILFILYFALLLALVLNLGIFSNSGLNKIQLTLLFSAKVMAGCLYGLIHQHYYDGGDTWAYFNDSLIIYDSVPVNWNDYLALTFGPNNVNASESMMPYIYAMGFWNDTPAYSVVRLHSFFNLLSLGNYYINLLFFNFISFIGLIGLYRFFQNATSKVPYWLLFLPSILFWFSGAHKDALVLAGIGITFFGLKKLTSGATVRGVTILAAGAVFTYLIRDYLLLLILPGLLAYLWTSFKTKWAWLKFSVVYLAMLLAATLISVPDSSLAFIDLFKHKQDQFLSLFPGTSHIDPPFLDFGLISLLKATPEGFINACFRPFPTELSNTLQILSFLELVFIFGTTCFMLIRKFGSIQWNNPKVILGIFIFLSIVIMVGIVVPNIGAICRYRALAWPFLLLPLFARETSHT